MTGRGSENRVFSADEVTVIVPVYNEARVLDEVLQTLRATFASVICVDDASTDDSARIAAGAGATVVRHPVNLGQGAALQTGLTFGLRHTASRVFVTFDADGQHDPQDAAALSAEVLSGRADVALGSRFLEETGEIPRARRQLLKLGVVFTRVSTRLPVTDTHNGLRALSRAAALRIDLKLRGMAHASELLRLIADHELSFVELPVHVRYTEHSLSKGQSNLNAVNILADVFLQGVFRKR